SVLREALAKTGLPEDGLVLVEDTSREAAVEFMRLRDFVDVLIPRGGHSLIQSILDNATVPYVIDGDGNCQIYVDESADLGVAVVPSLDAAIEHVNRNSSGHTEAIVTSSLAASQRFTREVDAAVVNVNASTRFTDGEMFGFGAEIGISTQKLHARGPMGLRE